MTDDEIGAECEGFALVFGALVISVTVGFPSEQEDRNIAIVAGIIRKSKRIILFSFARIALNTSDPLT